MKSLFIVSVLFLAGAFASAQDFQVGQYYAPYGECVGNETTSVNTVYETPATYYQEEPVVYQQYYTNPVYYHGAVTYAPSVYYPSYYYPRHHYRTRSYRHGYRRDRRGYCRGLR